MNPKVECCSVWGMLLNVTPSNHTHYHPCHFVSFKFKVWLLSNTINMHNTVVYWVCNWHCAGQSALEIFIFFNFCRFWQRNLLDSCKYWRTMHIPSTSPSSLWYECPPPSRNHCQQFRDALSLYVSTHHTTSFFFFNLPTLVPRPSHSCGCSNKRWPEYKATWTYHYHHSSLPFHYSPPDSEWVWHLVAGRETTCAFPHWQVLALLSPTPAALETLQSNRLPPSIHHFVAKDHLVWLVEGWVTI